MLHEFVVSMFLLIFANKFQTFSTYFNFSGLVSFQFLLVKVVHNNWKVLFQILKMLMQIALWLRSHVLQGKKAWQKAKPILERVFYSSAAQLLKTTIFTKSHGKNTKIGFLLKLPRHRHHLTFCPSRCTPIGLSILASVAHIADRRGSSNYLR